MAERKAKDTEEKIKKQTETNRQNNYRGKNTPIPGMFNGPMMPPLGPNMNPNMPPNMPPNMAAPGMPNMMMNPPPGGMNMMGSMGPMMGDRGMPFKGMPGQAPAPMGPMQPLGVKGKIQQLIRDKERILDMDENPAKRILSENLKGLMEEQKIASSADSTRYISTFSFM